MNDCALPPAATGAPLAVQAVVLCAVAADAVLLSLTLIVVVVLHDMI
jgi:hypothetical protein